MRCRTVAATLVSVTLLGASGCGDDHQAPLAPTTPTPVTTTAGLPVTSLTIMGKTSSAGVTEWGQAWLGIVPGETARFTATATFADGTERDVTAESVWTCESPLGIVSPGVIRAELPGWKSLAARYGSGPPSTSRAAEVLLRVAPEGVFLLDVAVDDGRWATMDALVQVSSGAGTYSARTPVWGIVALPAAGETTLQVDKEGYATVRKSMTIGSDLFVECILQPAGAAQHR
jgi:hypothetical protein